MSNDTIKRSDAIKALNREKSDWNCDYNVPIDNCIERLKKVKSTDRPQGEWIDMGDFEQCSVCKGTRLKEFQSYYGKTTWIKTPYCPNCGASMKGADDGTD